DELTSPDTPHLDLRMDPKLAWALRHRGCFPVDVNSAPRELLLRVPGFGVRHVNRILQARRWSKVRLSDLIRLRVSMKKAMPFIETADHRPHRLELEKEEVLLARFAPGPAQLDLFEPRDASVVTGEF